LRVVLIGPVYPYRGGIAHYTAMLARALAERHETLVISFQRQYPGWLYPGKSDRDPSQTPLRVEAEYTLDPLDPRTWRRAARRAIEFGADLVVMQWWTTFWAPAFGSLARRLRQAGMPVTFIIHNVLPHETRPWDRTLARWVLSPAASLVVQSSREQTRLRTLGLPAPVTLAPMPLFTGLSGLPVPRDDARSRLGLPPDAAVALFFGVVRPYKGLACLLEAVALLRNAGTPVQLLVVGQIWEGKDDYLRQIARLRLDELVTLDDRYIPDEELPALFGAADVFVAPYIDGTQSAALNTALAFGLPAVATQILVDGANPPDPGLVTVPSYDAPALATAILAVLRRHRESRPAAICGWDALVRALELTVPAESSHVAPN
jgi:glycosyltransferase involved in cell wall biosynthesis